MENYLPALEAGDSQAPNENGEGPQDLADNISRKCPAVIPVTCRNA